jgi:hypothetical protein
MKGEEKAALACGTIVLFGILAFGSGGGLIRPLPPPLQIELDFASLAAALKTYRIETGAFPRGNNFVFIQAISGQRDPGRSQVYWIPPARRLSAKGEFLDPWGRPYQIGAMDGGTRVIIRSAGPDGEFLTSDDQTHAVEPPETPPALPR